MATPPKDVLDTIGKVLPGDAGRDAVHVAIVACQAAHLLQPGQRVGISPSASDASLSKGVAMAGPIIGIIDPFLREPVERGQWFWVFLLPQTTSAVRHEWTHPAFDPAPSEAPT